jgi:hypothetical protein
MKTIDGQQTQQPPAATAVLRPGEGRAIEASGAIAAVVVAAGAGCAALGVLVVLAEASAWAKALLTFYEPVGPLAGKTTVAAAVWALAWAGLHLRLRHRAVELSRAFGLCGALVAVGLVGTFPPFYQLFASGH